MRPELRMLGISPEARGAGIMEKMLYGTTKHENLTYKEVEEVLYAWDTRYCIPLKVLEEEKYDIVSPNIIEEEVEAGIHTQEEYDRDYVRVINTYILTIWA